jgi:hypothetical protein
VRFGQGFLFSPPRPVRGEALQGVERGAPRHDAQGFAARSPFAGAPPVQPVEAPASEPRPDRRAGMLAQLARGVVRR